MTNSDLRHMNRKELLEMLIAQIEENEKLKAQVEEMQSQLSSRQIAIAEAGSIAEAAVRLSGVFEAAQDAAARYLENVRHLSGTQPSPQKTALESVEAWKQELFRKYGLSSSKKGDLP